MNRIAKYATAAAIAGALAIPAMSPSSAATWHHGDRGVGPGAAVGFAAGAMIGAAAANAAYGPNYYDPGYAYEPGYAYQPGYAYGAGYDSYAYAPPARSMGQGYGPAYRPEVQNYSNYNEHVCTLSPSSVNYEPCMNRR